MKEELCMAMSEAEEREMETSAVVRAGASLMPSPMNETTALSFSLPSAFFLGKNFRNQLEALGRRRTCSCSQRILLAFSVGNTPAKT